MFRRTDYTLFALQNFFDNRLKTNSENLIWTKEEIKKYAYAITTKLKSSILSFLTYFKINSIERYKYWVRNEKVVEI